MNDPWGRFAMDSEAGDCAGYFERAADARRPGEASWFHGALDRQSIGPGSRTTTLAREVDRFLSRHNRGAVAGYLGFDAVGLFEPALRAYPNGSPFPLGELAFVPQLHTAAVPASRRAPVPPARLPRPIADTLPRARFVRSVNRLVQAIRAGEAFQVVLAHRRTWPRPTDLLARAGRLRRQERFSTFYYLRFGDRELVGATPESVAEVAGPMAYVDPIAGTLPRHPPKPRHPLSVDPKELCEHRMLVDLARNDLGRLARPGSVRLLWSERLRRYAHLQHLVSRVGARLGPRVGPWDVLAATFPAGTVCGAPKIRATELLRAEEGTWRGPYAGTAALIRPRRQATFALAIRGAFASGRQLYTAAGAGIVHRSDPDQEFHETLAKLSVVEGSLVGEER